MSVAQKAVERVARLVDLLVDSMAEKWAGKNIKWIKSDIIS